MSKPMRCVLFVFLDISVSCVFCKGTAASSACGRRDCRLYSSVYDVHLLRNLEGSVADSFVVAGSHPIPAVFHEYVGCMITESECQENRRGGIWTKSCRAVVSSAGTVN